jgi:hypothetical protein
MNVTLSQPAPLFSDIRTLIDSARQRATIAVSAELTLLYWQVGQRINTEILKGERAEYVQTDHPSLGQTAHHLVWQRLDTAEPGEHGAFLRVFQRSKHFARTEYKIELDPFSHPDHHRRSPQTSG